MTPAAPDACHIFRCSAANANVPIFLLPNDTTTRRRQPDDTMTMRRRGRPCPRPRFCPHPPPPPMLPCRASVHWLQHHRCRSQHTSYFLTVRCHFLMKVCLYHFFYPDDTTTTRRMGVGAVSQEWVRSPSYPPCCVTADDESVPFLTRSILLPAAPLNPPCRLTADNRVYFLRTRIHPQLPWRNDSFGCLFLALFLAMTTRRWRNMKKEVEMDSLKSNHFV